MANLSYQEKRDIRQHLIQGGYVLNFNNITFNEFVGAVTGLNINDPKYSENNSGSKGQRLLKFIEEESDFTVGTLLKALYDELLDFNKDRVNGPEGYSLYARTFARLIDEGNVIEHVDAIRANNEDKDFHFLAKLIRESIEKNEPEAALDRLHTYMIKFLKELCRSHGVDFKKDETVNALYGNYVKTVRNKGFIQSDMADKIMKFSFQIMDAFNDIRNNKSFAHDNQVLNYEESVLIFSNVSAMVRFIQVMETKHKNVVIAEAAPNWDNFG